MKINLMYYFKKAIYLVVIAGFSLANAGSYEDFFMAIKQDTPAPIQNLLQRGFDANTIDPAGQTGKPLVIHTRSASDDTMAILKEEGGGTAGQPGAATGVFHCFTETMAVARAALDLGFYISFSGILTFKNAADLREVARFVPLDRMLIETDSPYLAPMPYRGKTNNPSYVPYVAKQIAELTQQPIETIANATSRNFEQLFTGVKA